MADNYSVTPDMIRAACRAGQYPEPVWHGQGGYSGVAALFNSAMERTHYAHSLKQVAGMVGESTQETGGFWFLTEAGGPFRYDPYCGRGYTQLTWKDNYLSFGRWLRTYGIISDSEYFVNNPNMAADLTYAPYVAIWEFDQTYSGRTLWSYADSADSSWARVSRAINTGSPDSNFQAYAEPLRAACCNAVLKCSPSIISGGLTMAQIDDINYKLDSISKKLDSMNTVKNPSTGKATSLSTAVWSVWYYAYNIAKKLGVR